MYNINSHCPFVNSLLTCISFLYFLSPPLTILPFLLSSISFLLSPLLSSLIFPSCSPTGYRLHLFSPFIHSHLPSFLLSFLPSFPPFLFPYVPPFLPKFFLSCMFLPFSRAAFVTRFLPHILAGFFPFAFAASFPPFLTNCKLENLRKSNASAELSLLIHLADFREKRENMNDILGVGLNIRRVHVEQEIGNLRLERPLRFR